MNLFAIFFLFICSSTRADSIDAHGVHLPLYRRSGSFIQEGPANFTKLSQNLAQIEARYARTHTDVEGNRIVRRWSDGPHGADEYLLNGAGNAGFWYTILQVGNPPQELEVDIDMLSPDFYTIMTTSGKGSKYDTFASSSHEPSQESVHPTCLKTTEIFHLPIYDSSSPSTSTTENNQETTKTTTTLPIRVPFPVCQPPKYHRHTLQASGSILGLSPATHRTFSSNPSSPLSRLTSPPLLSHLLDTSTLTTPLVHITLLSSTRGLLSLGAPPTYILEKTKVTLEKQLSHLSSTDSHIDPTQLDNEVASAMSFLVPAGSSPDTHFTWTDSGSGGIKGWHGGMLSGVWVNGVKVLRNQAVVFDVNCPVIFVPTGIGQVLFGVVGGRKVGRLVGNDDDDDDDGVLREREDEGEQMGERGREKGFWAYPCLNVPIVEVEIGGWRFPITARGEFGVGKVDFGSASDEEAGEQEQEQSGTGYCVSVIIETYTGVRSRWERSGMKDVWVLGEPFFRSVGVAFDFGGAGAGRGSSKDKGGRVGVRRY